MNLCAPCGLVELATPSNTVVIEEDGDLPYISPISEGMPSSYTTTSAQYRLVDEESHGQTFKKSIQRMDSGYNEPFIPDSGMEQSIPELRKSLSAILDTNSTYCHTIQPLVAGTSTPSPDVCAISLPSITSSPAPSSNGPPASNDSSRRSSVTRRFQSPGESSRHTSRGSSLRSREQSIRLARTRPVILSRTSSISVYDRSKMENPYRSHQRAREIFQSTSSGPNAPEMLSPDQQFLRTRPFDLTSASVKSQGVICTTTPLFEEPNGESSNTTKTPAIVPCTIIDWTSPSTRRREYEKIDRSTRGVRGLWRKLCPRRLQRSQHIPFYKEDDEVDDGASVRRYRLDIPDVRDGKGSSRVEVKELGRSRPRLFRLGTAWSCFGASDGS